MVKVLVISVETGKDDLMISVRYSALPVQQFSQRLSLYSKEGYGMQFIPFCHYYIYSKVIQKAFYIDGNDKCIYKFE